MVSRKRHKRICNEEEVRKMKKIMFSVIVSALLALPSMASAACIQAGYVERVTTKPGGANSAIYVRPTSMASYVYSSVSKDPKLVDAALAAATSRTRVQIKGSAASCPKSGNTRNIGAMIYLILAP